MSQIWSEIPSGFTNEADVEVRLVLPLLRALGYGDIDIASKHPVEFREGRVGRRPEADFVCFNGPLRGRDTSLLVVEAKTPGEPLVDGRLQGESYAANLRAPILLLTNGELIQVWQLQPTSESVEVFAGEVRDLASHQGTLERLISKAAVLDYCRLYRVKTILEASSDYGRYETAELARASVLACSIDRSVARAGTTEQLSSQDLIDMFASGCVVVAPSGIGKTTLSRRIFEQAIEARWRDNARRLPFEMLATDLERTRSRLVDFMHQRLKAHEPGVSPAAFVDLLRDKGATVVCDGFDRASAEFRRELSVEFEMFSRDYPRVQLFVFSREAARPELNLPVVHLLPLDEMQQRQMERVVLGGQGSIISMMSDALSDLCENPLLLQLLLDFWKRENAIATRLEPLFRSWLEQLLNADRCHPVSAIARERALTLIAVDTVDGPTSGERAIGSLVANGIPADVLNELAACDAVKFSGSDVEIQHEALADYLRAKRFVSASLSDQQSTIETLQMPADGLYPVLLMALLPTAELQSALWRKIALLGPSVYFDALRHRFDISDELGRLDPERLSRSYLEDLLKGIEQPLDAFFPSLRGYVLEKLTADAGDDLGVVGMLRATDGVLSYKLRVREQSEPAVEVGQARMPGILRGINLDLLRYRLDSARLVAVRLLNEAVLDAAKRQMVRGGPTLAMDRLMGRLRLISGDDGDTAPLDMTLDQIETEFAAHRDEWIPPQHFSDHHMVPINELLDDVAVLRRAGATALDPWWRRLGWDEDAERQDDEVLARVLDEQFRRSQVIYNEIVTGTFPAIADSMAFHSVLPIRWKLTVVRDPDHGQCATVYFNWIPTAQWSQAGADVEFSDKAPSSGIDVEDTRAALSALGRQNIRIPRHGGFTQLADFKGRRWTGSFDGSTAAVADACDYLMEDLKAVFSAVPHSD